MDLIGSPVDDIVLAPPHTVPKTSSGKIRRVAAREYYERGPTAVQPRRCGCIRAPRARRRRAAAAAGACARRAAGCSRCAAMPLFMFAALAVFPAAADEERARSPGTWAASHAVLPALAASRSSSRAGEHPAGPGDHRAQPHQLPRRTGAGRAARAAQLRLRRQARVPRQPADAPAARGFGTVFVERFDVQKAAPSTPTSWPKRRRPARRWRLPRGHAAAPARPAAVPHRRVPGRGAGRHPVVPVALRGMRSVLRDGTWFPRRCPVAVTVGKPMRPRARTGTPRSSCATTCAPKC